MYRPVIFVCPELFKRQFDRAVIASRINVLNPNNLHKFREPTTNSGI
jgi:hypothetical protein